MRVGDIQVAGARFVPKSMTTAERDAMTNVADGTVIYNNLTNIITLQVYRALSRSWETLYPVSSGQGIGITYPVSGANAATALISNTAPGVIYTAGDGISITTNQSGTYIANAAPGVSYTAGYGIQIVGNQSGTYIATKKASFSYTAPSGASLVTNINSLTYAPGYMSYHAYVHNSTNSSKSDDQYNNLTQIFTVAPNSSAVWSFTASYYDMRTATNWVPYIFHERGSSIVTSDGGALQTSARASETMHMITDVQSGDIVYCALMYSGTVPDTKPTCGFRFDGHEI